MKLTNHNIIIIFLFSLLMLVQPHAVAKEEIQRGRLAITNIQVKNVGDSIQLSFNCIPDQFAIRKKERVLITPVISDDTNCAKFSSFVIVGKKGKIPFVRSSDYQKDMKVVGYKQMLTYRANLKYEEWMKGSVLSFESSTKLCTKQAILTTAIVDGKILQDPDVEIIEIIKEIEPTLTTADKLAQDYGFLSAISEKSEFNEENRNKSVSILFRSGSSTILPDFQNNSRNLDLLVNVINKINQSSDSRISNILIVGYASPEGNYQLNLDFAEARAITLKDYLVQNAKVSTESFEMINGGVDWFGLHQMVNESDMADKEEVLKIIDSTPIKTSKETQGRRIELMSLKSGIPYRYMLKNFFPKLRSGTCIKVFYENINKKSQ